MEDQEIMEQFMETKQGYVIDNMNAVAGCGGIGVGEVMVSSEEILGVKYDDQLHEKNDFGDDDELKYVKEVQQSEKQHSMENVGDGSNSNELAEIEEVDKYKVGIEEENMHNQKDFENINHSIADDTTYERDDHNICDQLKHVIEAPPLAAVSAGMEYVAYSSAENDEDLYEVEKDEDSTSLTTNTNNENSLSENLMQPVACVEEKVSPFILSAVEEQTTDVNIEKNIDFEATPSQLNPEAKEFVPTFESNLLSPNSPNGLKMISLEENDLENVYFGQLPSAVPRHFMTEDDFVAQSPRKGRGDNMDTISVPAVQEFEEEADQRPHELESDNQTNIVEESIVNNDNGHEDALSDVSNNQDNKLTSDPNLIDHNDTNLIDHGPETYVDLDVGPNINQLPCMELSERGNDLMKQSIYVINDEAIENVLNSVQPIPTEIDSVNNSFAEEVSAAIPIVDKELLQIEEKEHISKSPSTEEIQMILHTSNKEDSQIAFDIKDTSLMHDSFYEDQAVQPGMNNFTEGIATLDTENLSGGSNKREETPNVNTFNSEKYLPDILETNDSQNELNVTHSLLSTDEKHLMEETKELQTNLKKSSIEHLTSEMAIDDDGIHPQVDEEEAIPVAMNNDEANNANSSERFLNKCEQIMVVDENTTGTQNDFMHRSPNQGEYTDVENIELQQTRKSIEYDLVKIEEISTDNKISSQLTLTVGANDTDTTSIDNLFEDITRKLNIVSSPITCSEFNKISDDSVLEQVLCGHSCKEQEDITETKLTSIEQMPYGEKHGGPQNIFEKEIASGGEKIRTGSSSEIMIDDAAADSVLEKVPSAACITSSVIASLPLEASSINAVKKTDIKNANITLKAKTTPSLSSSSKKFTSTEAAKKTIGVASKPKLPAVKPSTMSLSSDRKTNKTASAGAPIARKPISTATAAPKIPLKANLSSRSTQISTSTAKAVTSRPIAASRTITPIVRKPAASVTNTTAKTRPPSASAVLGKSNTLGVSGTTTSKPKVASPRVTLTSQMRKPAPSTTTAKSPVKSTIPSTLTKPATSSLGNRPKPVSSTVNSGGSSTIKATTARAAPKVGSCSTTTTRRLTCGGPAGGTATTNTVTKVITARKSSPVKSTFGKTPAKPVASSSNSNTKSVIKATPRKSTEDKLTEKLAINGGITTVNGSSQDVSITVQHQQSLLDHEDFNKPHTIDSNLASSEDIKRCVTDTVQEDLIGAYDQ